MDIIHDFLNQFKTTFTRPSFHHFARLVTGFAQITGPKAVTEVNDSANWSRHHSTIYDFFRKGKWQHQHITQDLMLWYLRHCKTSEEPLLLCVDDLCPLGTPKISNLMQNLLKNCVGMQSITNASEQT